MINLSPSRTDDVEGALRAFFQAEMPAPWPKLKTPPSSSVAKTAKEWPLLRSRLALAASVALLALGFSALAGAFDGRPTVSEPRMTILGAAADTRNDPLQHAVQPPLKVKIEESLIQEPGGTTIKVNVSDWPNR
jgi:hypothetical protein